MNLIFRYSEVIVLYLSNCSIVSAIALMIYRRKMRRNSVKIRNGKEILCCDFCIRAIEVLTKVSCNAQHRCLVTANSKSNKFVYPCSVRIIVQLPRC